MFRKSFLFAAALALAIIGTDRTSQTARAQWCCWCDGCCYPGSAVYCGGCDWAGFGGGGAAGNCDCNANPRANLRGSWAGGYMQPVRRARLYNWNRNYAYTDYGQPTALVVPPTAQLQTNYGWGVASSRISRIDHQFQRNFPGFGQFGGPFRPTPVWPSDTTQFGIYPVRAPW